jgi:hypothetical protein
MLYDDSFLNALWIISFARASRPEPGQLRAMFDVGYFPPNTPP